MDKHYKNKISFIDIVILLAPILIIIIRRLLLECGVQEVCLWKLLTGHECLGCGMMTAIFYMMKGEFLFAFHSNPLSFVVAPILLYCWLKYLIDVINRVK